MPIDVFRGKAMAEAKSFLVFREGEQRFGLNLREVERIEKCVAIESVSVKPEFVKGILNYHGELLPVIDIRRIFQLPEREDSLTDMLIIARTKKRALAIWAESIEGVVEKQAEEIEDAQRLFLGLDYVKGIFKFADKTVLINDLDKFITDRELKKLQRVMKQ
jgi:purine-binding chemotaxis protein CheW